MPRTVIELQVREPIKNVAACSRFLFKDLLSQAEKVGQGQQGNSVVHLESLIRLDGDEFELTYFSGAVVGGAPPNRRVINVPMSNVAGYTYATKDDFERAGFTKCDHCGKWNKAACTESKCVAKESSKTPAKAA